MNHSATASILPVNGRGIPEKTKEKLSLRAFFAKQSILFLQFVGLFRFLCLSAILSALWISLSVAGGSSYSRFGVGDLVYFGSSRTDAMGGAGIALLSDGFINRLNPAGLAKISRTRISGGFEYTNYSSTDPSGSGKYARGSFKGLAFGIPVDTDLGISLLLESSPYSNVNYAIESHESQLKQSFYGTGGLSLLGIGTSYSPSANLTVGVKFNYLFGRIRQIVKSDFTDNTFTDNELHRSDFYSGFNFTLGSIYSGIGDLLNAPSLKPLSLGLILSTPTTFSVEQERFTSTADTSFNELGNVDLPLGVGAGFSYLLSNRYYVTGDLYFQAWGQADFFGAHPAELRNSTRAGIGFEALPERETDTYFKRVAYRAGIYYNSTYYKINNTPVNEIFVTGGVGLPIGPDTRLNIGFHAGMRGETSNNLQKDYIFKLSLTLSASEAWFIKIEEE